MHGKTILLTAAAMSALALTTVARAQDPGEAAFRGLYKELVEIDTTASAGSCTAAAQAMGARLKAAGFREADVQVLFPPEHPKAGALVATLRGKDPKAGAILLLAHIDVVEAKREDWVRDPFKLVEEDGYFYARGASDDKAMAAIFTDSLIRYKQEGFKPRRDIKLALTCGEEGGQFNSVPWLLKDHPETMKAAFALNEGDDSRLDDKGQPKLLSIQVGEKVYMDYNLEVTNPGGHSSRPVKDNAIYHLAAGLSRLGAYDFPIALNDATKAYFEQNARIETDAEMAGAMSAIVKDPTDAAAATVLARDPARNSMMRTTCVATMVNAGHAPNALPQRAKANVNCRILPGNDHPGRRARPGQPAAAADAADHGSGDQGGQPDLAGDSVHPRHADRRHGRPLHQRRRRPDLRPVGADGRHGRRQHPRPERAHPGQGADEGPPLPA
jgi:acetylornithine deacetylase/succinyl-diaminopimelate desuccinylase-like protein